MSIKNLLDTDGKINQFFLPAGQAGNQNLQSVLNVGNSATSTLQLVNNGNLKGALNVSNPSSAGFNVYCDSAENQLTVSYYPNGPNQPAVADNLYINGPNHEVTLGSSTSVIPKVFVMGSDGNGGVKLGQVYDTYFNPPNGTTSLYKKTFNSTTPTTPPLLSMIPDTATGTDYNVYLPLGIVDVSSFAQYNCNTFTIDVYDQVGQLQLNGFTSFGNTYDNLPFNFNVFLTDKVYPPPTGNTPADADAYYGDFDGSYIIGSMSIVYSSSTFLYTEYFENNLLKWIGTTGNTPTTLYIIAKKAPQNLDAWAHNSFSNSQVVNTMAIRVQGESNNIVEL